MDKNSIEAIIKEMKEEIRSSEVGNLKFEELTLKQQRQILNGGFESVEIPAKFAILFNKFIEENVTLTDDMLPSTEYITLDTRPFVLLKLRQLSFGMDYINEDGKFTFGEVTENHMKPSVAPLRIDFGKFKVQLRVPNLVVDNEYNAALCKALEKFKRQNLKTADLGEVADLYNVYEMLKYVEGFSYGENFIDFAETQLSSKLRWLDSIPAGVAQKIKNYIEKVKQIETTALTATNEEGSTIADINTIFFAKTADQL